MAGRTDGLIKTFRAGAAIEDVTDASPDAIHP